MTGTAPIRSLATAPSERRGPTPRVVRQASAWLGGGEPERVPLQRLEDFDGIRWVDLDVAALDGPEALALLEPVCRGELTGRMVRDLISPSRFPAGREYPGGCVSITSAFRTRHLQPDSGSAEVAEVAEVASIFEPIHFLAGSDWLVSAWLEPRVFRGRFTRLADYDDEADQLFAGVARAWTRSDAESVEELTDLVRRELAVACGYRPAP